MILTVRGLIEKLQQMPPDAEVGTVYDEFCIKDVEAVWLARSGMVLFASEGDLVMDGEDQPVAVEVGVDEVWWAK